MGGGALGGRGSGRGSLEMGGATGWGALGGSPQEEGWSWGVEGNRAIKLCSSQPHLPADVFLAPSGLAGCRAHLFTQRSASMASWMHTGLLPAPLGPQPFPAETPFPDSHPWVACPAHPLPSVLPLTTQQCMAPPAPAQRPSAIREPACPLAL